jgi:hypothetical protein
MACRQDGEVHEPVGEKSVSVNGECPRASLDERCEGRVDVLVAAGDLRSGARLQLDLKK